MPVHEDPIGPFASPVEHVNPYRQLSEHFSLEELVASDTACRMGIDNAPSQAIIDELKVTCDRLLEPIRRVLRDQPIEITSGYRCPDLNIAVGGVAHSAHASGRAVDFVCPKFGTPYEICVHLTNHMRQLEIDQLIHEHGSWVHVARAATGTTARLHVMTIDGRGTRQGLYC
jgi:hypothetical protein